ncbi:hypothetical protein [Tumebacillus sp. BK434]|uniref:hypothetical protein n=1 Tax=Tumebacillus sp. BK434 TaxID=2512169 RepID=UPI001045F889|nr:hypothetical protein [Tumebacillus sp. BK434]
MRKLTLVSLIFSFSLLLPLSSIPIAEELPPQTFVPTMVAQDLPPLPLAIIKYAQDIPPAPHTAPASGSVYVAQAHTEQLLPPVPTFNSYLAENQPPNPFGPALI